MSMKPVTIEVLPPETSMSGQNSVYHYCPSTNHRCNYGVCLFTIRSFNNEKLNGESECYSLIDKKLCPALKLQAEEIKAGRALYYFKRELREPEARPLAPEKPMRASIWSKREPVTSIEKSSQAEPAAKESDALFGKTATLADALNEVVKDEVKKKVTQSKAVPVEKAQDEASKVTSKKPQAKKAPITVKSGMSLLERARAMKAAQQGA